MASKTRKLIEEVGTQVAWVRERLLNPRAGMLEPVAPELEQAIRTLRQGELRQGEGTVSPGMSGSGEESLDWESARRLGRELARVKALARQANEFYGMRIRLLAQNDLSVSYSRNGVVGGSSAEMPAEMRAGAPSQGDSVLHG